MIVRSGERFLHTRTANGWVVIRAGTGRFAWTRNQPC